MRILMGIDLLIQLLSGQICFFIFLSLSMFNILFLKDQLELINTILLVDS